MSKRKDRLSVQELNLVERFSGGASELVFWSFRYFLGRTTIHATVFARELAASWVYLDEKTQEAIRRELNAEFARDDAARQNLSRTTLGHDCDRAAWQLVRDAYANPDSNPPTITHD